MAVAARETTPGGAGTELRLIGLWQREAGNASTELDGIGGVGEGVGPVPEGGSQGEFLGVTGWVSDISRHSLNPSD